MVKANTSLSLVLDKRSKKNDNTYPVKLRVIHNRDSRKYSTGFSNTEDDFRKIMRKNPRGTYAERRAELEALKNKAMEIIHSMRVFSFDEFYPRYTGKGGQPNQVFASFDAYIDDLKREGRVGSAITYECARNSLKKFYRKEKLQFKQIDVSFIKRYYGWMIKEKGNSRTTVGIYLRCLRALYNRAIHAGYVSRDFYPFGSDNHGKFQIPASSNVKKALTIADIEKIFKYEPASEQESQYRDIWLFSYLANGANIKDICLLKYKDIEEGRIVFWRAKTSDSKKKSKPIVALITDQLSEIIKRWGNSPDPDHYVFPFLKGNESPAEIKRVTNNLVRSINQVFERISDKLELSTKVTTYTARHSFATILKRSGVPVAFISDALGHADLKTTENYLSGFEDDAIKDIVKNLTNFTGSSQ